MQDSPVFNYINSLSPIRPVKSIPNPHQFSALNFTSPPSVFTSPHLTSSHKESRFFKTHHPSPDPTIPVQESPDDSTSNEGAAAEAEVTPNFNIDASTEMEQPHIAKETNLDDLPLAVSPCGRETTGDLSLVPYASPPREENGEDDTGMEMYDNVQGKNETPDWDRLIADSSEFLIFSSPNDSEAFRCLMMQRASPSQAPSVMMPTMQPGSINEPESSNASPYGAVSVLHRGIRRRCLDFEMPGNKQTSSENNTSACGSSSRCVVPTAEKNWFGQLLEPTSNTQFYKIRQCDLIRRKSAIKGSSCRKSIYLSERQPQNHFQKSNSMHSFQFLVLLHSPQAIHVP
ncbi:hypothetical protein F2Q68_00030680 [Brassica cretica]|uniref:Uncharacterized protein n=1 Tax=Brassica cretica TaxID=69181 RepID=A0A8S9G6U5_BRACR|nr:hypothetical protein F2Q68_00030680 [Brassica cretica]